MSGMRNSNNDSRQNGDDGTRFDVSWGLVAGHRTLRTVRGHVSNISVSGVLIHVPVQYDIGNLVEIEMSPSVGVFIRAVVQIVREHARSVEITQYGTKIVSQTVEHRAFLREILLDIRRKQLQTDFGREPRPTRKSVR